MNGEPEQMLRRIDYRPPAFLIDEVDLHFDLALPITTVHTRLSFRRNEDRGDQPLVLDGVNLVPTDIRLDNTPLSVDGYLLTPRSLVIVRPPQQGTLSLTTRITPLDTEMEGLVYVDGTFVTHCEPAGFRRITYFPDRPDVLARYRCTLAADARTCPILLSNGHLVEAGSLPGNRHFARWDDPYPKACYLFALVAGKLAQVEDRFVTRSGRPVSLSVHAREADLPLCRHGLGVLKQAMAWDEAHYGREYDLDALNVAVLRDYPGGAMENKGLNLYASEFFLGSPECSTDDELRRVEATIAHEYFHNWSGNRVGCRDWFELSLKEGLTIFRQQEFMASRAGASIARIDDVIRLREQQYPEDDGAMAHAVRPDSYRSANNLYTRTVYEKGAELIRMLKLLIGERAYDRGIRTFFNRHDGRAATIEDFISAMENDSGEDLSRLLRWYSTVGAWHIQVTAEFDQARRRYEVRCRQIASARDPEGGPLLMPMRITLLDPHGRAKDLPQVGGVSKNREEHLLRLHSADQRFVFEPIEERPVPSLFRGHCAPVRVETDLSDIDLALLAVHDSDDVNRWDVVQLLASRALLEHIQGDKDSPSSRTWLEVIDALLTQPECNAGLSGRMLQLPTQRRLAQQQDEVDIEGIWQARQELAARAAQMFRERLRAVHRQCSTPGSHPDGFGARTLGNACLWYLMRDPGPADVAACHAQWRESRVLENRVAAFRLLVERGGKDRDQVIRDAYQQWRITPLLLDHWFAQQATVESPDCAVLVQALSKHPEFSLDNATRLKALFDSFTLNLAAFHDASGMGYHIVTDIVQRLNRPNPRLAARFMKAFSDWRHYDSARRGTIASLLQSTLEIPDLAPDLLDICDRLLRGVESAG